MTKDDTKVIIEYFDDKFAVLLENVETVVDNKLKPVADDAAELKSDMKIVKAAVTATNAEVTDLQAHVARLETA